MENRTRFYIGGNWVAPSTGETRRVVNPATEEPIGSVAMGGERDMDRAVRSAAAAFDSYSRTTREERIALLERVVARYEERLDEIADTIREEVGAPTRLSREFQAPMGLAQLTTTLEALRGFSFEEELGSARVVREPIGVCGLITPWNWPANQIACKVAPALAAGCSMVLKPSEIAPHSAILFAEILDSAGIPPGVFNLVHGDGPTVGAALSAHPGVDMISFTGSTRAGVEVARNAAPTVKRVAQELGGKSASVILDDADLERAVARDVARVYANSGQSCLAPTRMLVPRAWMDEAAALARAAMEAVQVGSPRDLKTDMGPLASRRQLERVRSLIQTGLDEGARLETGGTGRPDGSRVGHYVKPTVFSHARNDMTIARQEIFGPVLTIIGYEDEEDAARVANDTTYGLAGYVSSGDPERAHALARRLRVGSVFLNDAFIDPRAPFGGYKRSGNGRESGRYGLEEFLETKAITGHEG